MVQLGTRPNVYGDEKCKCPLGWPASNRILSDANNIPARWLSAFFFKIKWLFLKLFLYSIFLNCQLKIVQWFLHELPPLALALPMSFSHCRQLSSLLFFFFQENLSCKNLQFVLNSTVYFLSNVELPEGGEIGRKTKWKR